MSDRGVDETDIKILRMLQVDARESFREIASQCGVSKETVKNRFDTMKKKGIIRGTSIVINPRRMDKKHIVIIGIQTTQPYSNQVLNKVKRIPGICVATRAVGRYDVEVIAIQKDIQQIGNTRDVIGDFQQVKNVDVDIFVDKPLLCPKNFEFE
jgi:Lrp/AsnC family transcriptional regulator for asnA, asnC and gidA